MSCFMSLFIQCMIKVAIVLFRICRQSILLLITVRKAAEYCSGDERNATDGAKFDCAPLGYQEGAS